MYPTLGAMTKTRRRWGPRILCEHHSALLEGDSCSGDPGYNPSEPSARFWLMEGCSGFED